MGGFKKGAFSVAAKAGVPVVVGTGAQNTRRAADLAAHAKRCGAKGLMLIPRVLSRGSTDWANAAVLPILGLLARR